MSITEVTKCYIRNVEEIISLYRVLDYNRDMFALRYPLNIPGHLRH